MADVMAQELGDKSEKKETTEQKKGWGKKGGEYKAPGNMISFAESAETHEKLKRILSVSIDSLYDEVKNWGWLQPPRKIRQDRDKLNKWKYCAYHGDIVHFTSECKDQLHQLWKYYEEGKLEEFVKKAYVPRVTAFRRCEEDDNEEEGQDKDLREQIDRKKWKVPPMADGGQPQEILMLQPNLGPVGGCSKEGILVSAAKRKRKAAVRELDHVETGLGLPPKKALPSPLMFTTDNLKGVLMPHNDPLVISMNIMGTKVHRLLVDIGSYANIIFRSTLSKLGNYDNYLQPCNHRILGFGDVVSVPDGIIRLTVELVSTENPKHHLTRILDFLIVE
ncbi:hypothetical protein ACS0TY_033054 [Phlomoides rotata]